MAEKIPESSANIPGTASQGQISVDAESKTFEEKVLDVIEKMLRDPTQFPAEYRAWLPRFIEGQNIQLPVSQVIGASAPRIVGEFVMWGGAGPAGYTGEQEVSANYLLANGADVDRLRWPQLFESYDVKYGSGDGSTTFGLPNLLGKFVIAEAAAGDFAFPAGTTGGFDAHNHTHSHTHTLSSHTHVAPNHTHTMGNHSHVAPFHAHSMQGHQHTVVGTTGTSNDGGLATQSGAGASRQQQAHNHNISMFSGGPTSADTGGGGSASTGGPSPGSTDGANITLTTGAPSTNTSGSESVSTTSNASSYPPYVIIEAWLIYAGVKVE